MGCLQNTGAQPSRNIKTEKVVQRSLAGDQNGWGPFFLFFKAPALAAAAKATESVARIKSIILYFICKIERVGERNGETDHHFPR